LRKESRVFGNPSLFTSFRVATIHPRWFGEEIIADFFIALQLVRVFITRQYSYCSRIELFDWGNLPHPVGDFYLLRSSFRVVEKCF
jgi:hypothetical protein